MPVYAMSGTDRSGDTWRIVFNNCEDTLNGFTITKTVDRVKNLDFYKPQFSQIYVKE